MNIPVFSKYFSINLLIYVVLIRALFCLLISSAFIFGILGFMWIYFVYVFLLLDFFIPINLILIIFEFILFKAKLIKHSCNITITAKCKKIIYSITMIALIYYLWYKLYFEHILNENLLFD